MRREAPAVPPMQHAIQHQAHDAKGGFSIGQASQRVAEMTCQRTGARPSSWTTPD